jgi:hypothetical protein
MVKSGLGQICEVRILTQLRVTIESFSCIIYQLRNEPLAYLSLYSGGKMNEKDIRFLTTKRIFRYGAK